MMNILLVDDPQIDPEMPLPTYLEEDSEFKIVAQAIPMVLKH